MPSIKQLGARSVAGVAGAALAVGGKACSGSPAPPPRGAGAAGAPGSAPPPGVAVAALAVVVTACSGSAAPSSGVAGASGTPGSASAPAGAGLSRTITIDGSSTVYPITEAVAEEFQKANSGVKVTVAFAGTGGGFKKFCNGETDMNDASRPITADEKTACSAKSVDYVELQVAIDGLSVLVNPQNTWVDCFTTAELKKIWDQGSTVKTWADVRAGWPADAIKLFGPGA